MTKIIRWKFVLPTALGISGLLIFLIIFFDPFLAKAISMIGSRINGAKVDVSGLHTKIFQGRLSIARLEITDKENTIKNLIEAGPMTYQMDFSELLSRRVIIPEASLEGLQFNTDRKHDGKLWFTSKKKKDEKPGAADKLTERYKNQFKLNLAEMKTETQSKLTFDPKELTLTKQADSLKATTESLPESWKKKVAELKIDDRLKKVEVDLKEIQNTPTHGAESLTALPASLKKLKQVKSELDQIKSDLKSTREGMTGNLRDLKSGIAELKDAKKKDTDDLLSRLHLDFANPKRLIEGLVGEVIYQKVKRALHYFELVRTYLPSKKEQENLPQKPRSGGMDIEFPTPAALPRFWLKHASLSGNYESVSGAGVMTHLTTNPSRVGKPFVANFKGSKGTNQFLGELIADHLTDVSKDRLKVQVKNMSLLNFLQGSAMGNALEKGSGDVDIEFSLTGDKELNGRIKLDLSNLRFDQTAFLTQLGLDSSSRKKEDALKMSFIQNVVQGMEKMPVSLTGELGGSWSNPTMKLSSNLDNLVKNAVKKSFGSLADSQKKEIEAKLDSILNSRKSELDQKSSGLESQITGLLSGLDSSVQQQINKATQINLGGGEASPLKIPALDKLFNK